MNVSRHCRIAGFRRILLGIALLATFEATFAQVTITERTTPTLGTLLGGPSGRNFILNTDQTVSGTDSADHFCCAVSGDLRIQKGGGPALSANIVAENITTSGGVSVNAVPCSFDGGAQTSCDGSGINVTLQGNKTLLVGVDIDTSQTHSGGDTASVTYDITVTLL